MTDLAATFLRSLREALSRVALQPDATVVSQVSADFDAMKWCDTILMLQPCGRSAALAGGA
jgi:hypothetical protein